jgi:hypothetical protein
VPFLTDLDSRAAIKGSRDPLGLVPVWSRFGRNVVGNLSTVSNSVRGFTTLLLGYYFAEAVLEQGAGSDQSTLDIFLKFEQLAGYARFFFNNDDSFRGRDRVELRLQKGSKVTLGADQSDQILSNQKIYGLWGLFSVPARASGLLAQGETILTPDARRFVEERYVAQLTADGVRGGRPLIDLLQRERAEVFLDGRDERLAKAVANLLTEKVSAAERAFYDTHLVKGGPTDNTHGEQPQLAHLLGKLPVDTEFDMKELRATIRRAPTGQQGGALTAHLESIAQLEAILVPMENAFAFLLSRDRQTLSSVADEIRDEWGRGLRHIRPQAILGVRATIDDAFHDARAADRIVQLAEAFESGEYEAALRLLLEHNAFIMYARNGSQPWARLEGNKVDVRYRDESGRLISAGELADYWRNTYFINSLKTITSTLRAA